MEEIRRLEGGIICVEFSEALVSCGGSLNSEEQCFRGRRDDTWKQHCSGDQREARQGDRNRNLVVVGQESLKGCLSFDSFVLCHLKVCSVESMCILNLGKALNWGL